MLRPDTTDVQWILDALQRDRTKSRKGIGDAINIDKTGVSRLLNGARALKMREGLKIAEYLGVAAPIGFSEDEASFDHSSRPSPAPIYRSSLADESPTPGWRLYRSEQPIDYRPKAAHFASAALVFGIYAQDDSMAPRFKPGELIFVDPSRPITPGDDVLFIARRKQGEAERAVIGELVSATPATFTYIQHVRKGERRLPAKTWTANLILKGY